MEVEKKKKWWLIGCSSALILFFLFLFLPFYFLFVFFKKPFFSRKLSAGGSVALIRVEGEISASQDGLSGITPEKIIEQLRWAEKDDSIKAILLRINSPGGTAAASQEIFTELKRAKKPVVASIADIGASGAYWVACGADKIVASPSSAVGSIGVIITLPNFKGLLDKLGVSYIVITKGKYKDIGNPARPLTEEERKVLDEQAEVIYRDFIENVAESRNLSLEEVEKYATGLTYLGSQAKEMGLVDQLGNYTDAVKLAAKLGKIKGEPEVEEYEEPFDLRYLRHIFNLMKSGIDFKRFFSGSHQPIFLP